MLKIISPTQTIEEIKFVKKFNNTIDILPLDLSTLLFCISNNLSFINPNDYSNNQLHTEIIKQTDFLLSKINIPNQSTSIVKEYIAICRFYLHQLYFVKTILQRIIDDTPKIRFFF